jgi:hypothetical protein
MSVQKPISHYHWNSEIEIEKRNLTDICTLCTNLTNVSPKWNAVVAPEKDSERALANGAFSTEARPSHLEVALWRENSGVNEREFWIEKGEKSGF